jgi:2-C-methyl-D-erythritol 4-phosphate cytidylyltransferase
LVAAREIAEATSGPEWAAYVRVVAGGAERGDSVAAGLAALGPDVDVVLVHDAARALAPSELFDRVAAAVRAGAPAAVPGVPVVDTVKQVDEQGHVTATPPRATLRAIQTPQGFRRDVLERAHAVWSEATDDAALVERLGLPVLVVDGDRRALKVTTADDLETAARILAE